MTQPTADDPLELTPDELATENHDRKIRDILTVANQNNELPSKVIDNSIEVGELEYWASLGNISKVKLALKNGENVNAAGDDGYTALHAAAVNSHLEVVKLLIQQNANLNAKLDSGETVIELAGIAGENDIVEYLKSVGH